MGTTITVECKVIFKRVIFLFVVAFFVCGGHAKKIEHPYFWKVEKDGKVSYLLGAVNEPITINDLLCPVDIRLHLENSDLVLVETDFYSERNKEAVDARNQLMQSEDSREFRIFSPESQVFLRSKGVSENLNLYGYVTALTYLCAYGVPSIDGLTLAERILDVAHSKKIPVQELDDFDEKIIATMRQRERIARMYEQVTNTKLLTSIGLLEDRQIRPFDRKCPPQALVDTIEGYTSGLQAVRVVLDHLNRLNPWHQERYVHVIHEGSKRWLDRFEEAHKNYDRIFLIGELIHFMSFSFGDVGYRSILDMMEDKGYETEPVTCEKTIAL